MESLSMSKTGTRMRDLELAVGSLACILERVVSGEKKWSKDERADMMGAAGRARMLVDCEHMPSVGAGEYISREQERELERDQLFEGLLYTKIAQGDEVVARAAGIKEKIEPELTAGPRFFVDLPSGDAYSTDDAAEVRNMYERGQITNVYDRQLRAQLIFQGTIYAVGAQALGYPPVGESL